MRKRPLVKNRLGQALQTIPSEYGEGMKIHRNTFPTSTDVDHHVTIYSRFLAEPASEAFVSYCKAKYS